MELKTLNKIVEKLLKYYPPDVEVWLDDENIMVLENGVKIKYSIDELLNLNKSVNINWDGISKVRAWIKGQKQRLYFSAVGIPYGVQAKGRVFLELVDGYWMPNMKYKLMQNLANQLNENNLFDAEYIEDLYKETLE